jgi:hypothetical protein
MINKSIDPLVQAWRAFFSTQANELPQENLEAVSQVAFQGIQSFSLHSPPPLLEQFCKKAASQQLVLEAATLRSHGLFPSILGNEAGDVLASRLVLNWNILLVKERGQLILVFQGVTSSDAVLLPGLDTLLLACHIDRQRVANCMAILSRTPEFFKPNTKPRFGGYLIGHSRPYHCLYDGLLALETIRQADMLNDDDCIFSKSDEAFLDLSACLPLKQAHQQLDKEALNRHCKEQSVYLLQLGFWFNTRAENHELRQLAAAVDQAIREAAIQKSQLNDIGAIAMLKQFQPLIWVGVTGQKRCWIEQVEGSAELLNQLYQQYPKLGIIFDGWTPPLTSSDYHRSEMRNDNKIIQKIIRKLKFKTRKNISIIAGLPLLDKIRVGLEADAFLANYTSGSLAIARICGKPGVGHMGRRMMVSKHQHIHHHTREPDPQCVHDVSDASTATGYVNYSIPWQALYNELQDILEEQSLLPTHQSKGLLIPDQRER